MSSALRLLRSGGRRRRSLSSAVLFGLGLALFGLSAAAQTGAGATVGAVSGAVTGAEPTDARGWLARIHSAASSRNYQGTMVVSIGGVVSSSRVAHFFVDDQVFERIEALDGRQRRVYRHNDVVRTVWPQKGLVVVERRGLQAGLPSVTQSVDPRALDHYVLRREGNDRIAGREAMVFLLEPRDALRFAQRVWADQETGLMLRSDVISAARTVIESAAFSEVEIGVRAQLDALRQEMQKLDALRVERRSPAPTQLKDQGWEIGRQVTGFHLAGCVKRPLPPKAGTAATVGAGGEVTQAVFSDGLTHVSLFIEPFDAERHRRELQAQFGATHSLALKRGDFWVTAMGDVPPQTLRLFVDALERRP